MFTSKIIAWCGWLTASMFYAYQYILRVMPNIMIDDITQQFHINAAIFGQFSGVYYIGYSLMHLPIGFMLDRFGPKKVMPICVLLTVIGLLPIIFAEHWIYPIIGRLLIGIGSSAAILGTFKIIRMTFKEQHFARMLSISVTIGLIGAIYGGEPVHYMCNVMGHKFVVEVFAVLGLLFASITYIAVPKIKNTQHSLILTDIKTILLNRKVIAWCCFAGCMVSPLEGFADVWGTVFLQRVYGFNIDVASYLPSMIFTGMCFGSPVLSIIAEKTRSYTGSIIGAGIIMFVVFTALIFGLLTKSSITVGFILVGICSAYQILAIYKASTYVTEKLAGLATAVANMIIMIFGYAFHTIIGLIVNACGGTGAIRALVNGISVIPISLAIGIIGLLMFVQQQKGENIRRPASTINNNTKI